MCKKANLHGVIELESDFLEVLKGLKQFLIHRILK